MISSFHLHNLKEIGKIVQQIFQVNVSIYTDAKVFSLPKQTEGDYSNEWTTKLRQNVKWMNQLEGQNTLLLVTDSTQQSYIVVHFTNGGKTRSILIGPFLYPSSPSIASQNQWSTLTPQELKNIGILLYYSIFMGRLSDEEKTPTFEMFDHASFMTRINTSMQLLKVKELIHFELYTIDEAEQVSITGKRDLFFLKSIKIH
ncbi:protein kinase [Geomicrobium sp. JCM 19055]|uniref:protein kinase n=1 Tax=Geomicrobium sp. JCM 19055 TaxID=1460649 RepID=UPI00045ED1FB|nr:protein kinase [Geomicrobium sp. JCM 19055]GAJ98086.1 hypothetical protein JCM19055_988 [Geomicrobium sp. JCM 19055]